MKHSAVHFLTRRQCLALLAFVPGLPLELQKEEPADEPKDWSCPMDPDVHLDRPGKCPRCGMTLALSVPERTEFPMEVTVEPQVLRPGGTARVQLRVLTPDGKPVTGFQPVHEKLLHLFVVSEDLEYFAHIHPQLERDGAFHIAVALPKAGMYRLLADYYPEGGVPQLSNETFYVEGQAGGAHLELALIPQASENLTASLRLEPEALLAGLQARLYYTLQPADGLEKYLGAWGHMLVASEDLIDLLHLHPFLANGGNIQYNVIFPRPGKYKVWSQFQREGVVNIVAFVVQVTSV